MTQEELAGIIQTFPTIIAQLMNDTITNADAVENLRILQKQLQDAYDAVQAKITAGVQA